MFLKYNLPWLAWGAIIIILISIPGNNIPNSFLFDLLPHADKIIHALLFLVFVILLIFGLLKQYPQGIMRLPVLFWAIGISVFYSGLTELLQEMVFKNRNADFYDFTADCVGIIAGVFIYMMYKKNIFRKNISIFY